MNSIQRQIQPLNPQIGFNANSILEPLNPELGFNINYNQRQIQTLNP